MKFILLGLIALASSSSQDATVYYGRGLAKSAKGDQDGAIADFSKAIELNPKLAVAYFNRGLAKRGDQPRVSPGCDGGFFPGSHLLCESLNHPVLAFVQAAWGRTRPLFATAIGLRA